jgi:hypothetical protein
MFDSRDLPLRRKGTTGCENTNSVLRRDFASIERRTQIILRPDASNLFGYTVKAADLTDDETFISTAAKFFTAPCTYVQSNDDEYNFVEIDPCKVAENGIIIVAQNKVAAHQKQANLLCKIMFSIWELVFRKNPEAGSKLLKEFFIIDEAKRQHAYDTLYARRRAPGAAPNNGGLPLPREMFRLHRTAAGKAPPRT